MTFHEIRTYHADGVICYARPSVEGGHLPTFDLKMGRSIRENYPDDPFTIAFPLDPDLSGLKKTSLLSNAGRLLLLRDDVATALVEHLKVGAVEVFPFTLLDERGRVFSKEYVIFNPLDTADCLDVETSDIKYRKNGSVLKIREIVLDGEKVGDLPDIVRLATKPSYILFSERAVAFIEEQGYTNFWFSPPLPISSSKAW